MQVLPVEPCDWDGAWGWHACPHTKDIPDVSLESDYPAAARPWAALPAARGSTRRCCEAGWGWEGCRRTAGAHGAVPGTAAAPAAPGSPAALPGPALAASIREVLLPPDVLSQKCYPEGKGRPALWGSRVAPPERAQGCLPAFCTSSRRLGPGAKPPGFCQVVSRTACSGKLVLMDLLTKHITSSDVQSLSSSAGPLIRPITLFPKSFSLEGNILILNVQPVPELMHFNRLL